MKVRISLEQTIDIDDAMSNDRTVLFVYPAGMG